MANYMVLYFGGADQMASTTDEEKEAVMKQWQTWMEKVGSALVDGGNPVMVGKRVSADSASDASSNVSGYSMLEADSLDDAVALMDGHPHFEVGDAEVWEIINMEAEK